ncbi:hypothetical protein LMTR13_25155 [Bradyrhizobium icense]|uniref:Integrase catalytic domain-containing protein n=1 Tax=Bradyrhizobium icense TaxID=1274631 RepID=A0A1B1UJJ3_9BRAD|nr:hypothetical protein LMTR13_25155 [Bradyrhizobium icense]
MLAPVADTLLSEVARELERLVIERGKPKMAVSDNGSELTSNAILTRPGDIKGISRKRDGPRSIYQATERSVLRKS